MPDTRVRKLHSPRVDGIHHAAIEDYTGVRLAPLESCTYRQFAFRVRVFRRDCAGRSARNDGAFVSDPADSPADNLRVGSDEVIPASARSSFGNLRARA